MKNNIQITKNIFWVGVNDRHKELFENYWPLPKGVSYNAYIINDEKVALIDAVDKSMFENFLEKIEAVIHGKQIDYLVINHMEPDHSGAINLLIQKYPDIKIVGNKKTFRLLENFYGITKNYQEIKEGDVLDLGKHKLQFYMVPMLHWPETMLSYETTTGILFSGDVCGTYGTLDGGLFDDEIDLSYMENEISRYYTNIVGKFSKPVRSALQKIKPLNITHICTTHGPVWRSHIDEILEKYRKWSNYETEEGVVIIFGSMYSNTEKMADYIAQRLVHYKVKNIRIYDVSKTHPSFIINDIFMFKGVILGSPTYNNSLFPKIQSLLYDIEQMGIQNHILGVFGSSGWSPGRSVRLLNDFAEKIKWDLIEYAPNANGSPKDQDWEICDKLAFEMARKLKE